MDERSVAAVRLATVLADRTDGQARLIELVRLLESHRSAGSELADTILRDADLATTFWLVEPIEAPPSPVPAPVSTVIRSQPDRNLIAAVPLSTTEPVIPTLARMIHPSDSGLRAIAVRGGQWAPSRVRPVAAAWRLRAKRSSTSTRSMAVTLAGCRVDCVDAIHDATGRPIAVVVTADRGGRHRLIVVAVSA